MTSLPSVNLLGVNVSRVDYESAVAAIIRAARLRLSFGATALAVHGVMEARRDPALAELINRLHLIAPDGQPVRWALNLLGAKELKDRVYGPTLTLRICERAAADQLPIFLLAAALRSSIGWNEISKLASPASSLRARKLIAFARPHLKRMKQTSAE